MLERGRGPAAAPATRCSPPRTRSFFHHGGIDLFGVVRSALVNLRARPARPGRLDHHHAARAHARSVAARRPGTGRSRETLLAVELEKRLTQAADPDPLLQPRLPRPRQLRHGGGGARLLRQGVADLTLARGGHARRHPAASERAAAPTASPTRCWRGATTSSAGCSRRASSTRAAYDAALASRSSSSRRSAVAASSGRTSPRRCAVTSSTSYGTERLYDRGPAGRHHARLARSSARPRTRCATACCASTTGAAGADRSCAARASSISPARRSRRAPDGIRDPRAGSPGLVLVVDRRAARGAHARRRRFALGPEGRRVDGPAARSRDRAARGRRGLVPARRAIPRASSRGSRSGCSSRSRELEGAVIVLESATGAVRALVGGWDFRRSKFDRATQAERQVGSAFKPFVYGAGVRGRLHPRRHAVRRAGDLHRRRRAARATARATTTAATTGILTLRRALEQSINVTGGQAARPGRRRAGDRLRAPLRHRAPPCRPTRASRSAPPTSCRWSSPPRTPRSPTRACA